MSGHEVAYNAAVVSSVFASACIANVTVMHTRGGGHLLEFGPSYDRVADYAMRIVRHVDLLCFS